MKTVMALPEKRGGTGLNLLDGVKVLDLTGSVAGPYAGQLLADMGATVVKVERPGTGDDARGWGPPFLDGEALWYLAVNRNKFSIAIDYTAEPGAGILKRLVEVADVVLVNQVARVQRKLGIDHAALSALQPKLIHASITGFGLAGPRQDLPCYDLIAEGYSSVMDLTGEAETGPQKVGTPAADLLAGQDAALAILAALYRRQNTGQGCCIDVALVHSMTRFMVPKLMTYLGSGESFTRSGGRDSVIAIYQAFETADRPITLGIGNDRIWGRFWKAMGDATYGANPRYASNAMRREHRAEIAGHIQTLLVKESRAYWLKLFAASGVPAGPINRVDEIVADPLLIDKGLFYRAPSADGGAVPQVGLGIEFDGQSEACHRTAPRLNADARIVLEQWLGLSASESEALGYSGEPETP